MLRLFCCHGSYVKDISLTLLLPLALVAMVMVVVEVGRLVWGRWRVEVVPGDNVPSYRLADLMVNSASLMPTSTLFC